MKALQHFILEYSILDPLLTGLCLGICTIGFDGQVYLTDLGQQFLDGVGE